MLAAGLLHGFGDTPDGVAVIESATEDVHAAASK